MPSGACHGSVQALEVTDAASPCWGWERGCSSQWLTGHSGTSPVGPVQNVTVASGTVLGQHCQQTATGHIPCDENHHVQSRTGFPSCGTRRRGTLPCSAMRLLCNCWRERSCYRKISSEGAVLRRHGAIQASSQMLLQSKLSIILLFCSEGSGSDWQFVALSSLHFPTVHKKQILLHSTGSPLNARHLSPPLQ